MTRSSFPILPMLALAALPAPALPGQPADIREAAVTGPALDVPPPAPTDGPVIKLALLLDTSNSMDGLIHQARTRLWQVVNELGKARVAGALPQLQVALFHYGNNGLPAADDYVQLRCPFTTDLDIVSEQLFGLSTNGGAEYCGAVIRESVQRLDWGEPGDGPVLKVVVIAGNEPFNQGAEPYQESIATARGLGIRLNTVFCGQRDEGRKTLWADGAERGGGVYAAIDQDERGPEIDTPYDEALRRLNEVLNGTYLGYGAAGAAGLRRQEAQDMANAAASPSASLSRVAAKASANYETSHWDLVSAVEEETVALEELEPAALPKPLHGLTLAEQEALLADLAEKRRATAEEIRSLTAKREAFLAKAREAEASSQNTLDDALLAALRQQAAEVGFDFES